MNRCFKVLFEGRDSFNNPHQQSPYTVILKLKRRESLLLVKKTV